MLKEEAVMICDMLKNVVEKDVLNICSSDEPFWKEKQPHVWKFVMSPLLERGCVLHNLDMKEAPGIDIINDCMDMVDVADAAYDVVLFFSGIEHVLQPSKVMSEIQRVLKKDGIAFMSAPGVYPKHDDPIDTMLRFPTREAWQKFIDLNAWEILEYKETTPEKAKSVYAFDELVYATVVKIKKREERRLKRLRGLHNAEVRGRKK